MNAIPLIKGNTPQEINTSIIALKKALSELEAQDRLLQGTDKDVQDKIKQINELIEGINTHLGTVDTHLTTIDGQITALQPVDTVTSGNMHSVTSNAVADALLSPLIYNDMLVDFNNAWYLGRENYEGIFFIRGNSANEPITTPYSWFVKTLHKTYGENEYVITQMAIDTDPYMIYTRTALSTDNQNWTWQSWKKVLTDNDVTISSWYVSVPPQEKVYFHRDVNTGNAYISRWIKLIINYHFSFGDSTSVSEYLLRLNLTPYNNQNYRGFTPALIMGITSQSAGNYDIINTLNLTWGWDDGGFYIVNTTDWATLNVTVISPFSKN